VRQKNYQKPYSMLIKASDWQSKSFVLEALRYDKKHELFEEAEFGFRKAVEFGTN
jgi:hypothetical protein